VCSAGAALLVAQALPSEARAAYSEGQTLFLEAWRALDKAYVDKTFNGQQWFRTRERFLKRSNMGSSEQSHSAIRELVSTLDDPFTRFLEPSEYDLVLEQQQRSGSEKRASVGVELTLTPDGRVAVVSSVPESSAERSGLSPGDVVERADGVPLSGKSLYQAADLLQGSPGTAVAVEVRKASTNEVQDLSLQRQVSSRKPLASSLCANSVGYLRVGRFADASGQAAREQLQKLQEQGASSYVLDLRSNPGGSLGESIELARALLPGGTVVNIADSQGIRDIYDTEGSQPALPASSKLVVLIDKGTASASEVLSGALRDNQRAKLVGATTFGKGLIQVNPLHSTSTQGFPSEASHSSPC
jgi:C-terminal peptidase prc